MNEKFRELAGLSVEVDNVMYVPELPAPQDKPYAFVYFIRVINQSDDVIVIKGRKWVVREEGGETVVVEGAGVVGEMPELQPGEEFSYNSCHVVGSDAVASGSLFGEGDFSTLFRVEIPEFSMKIPGASE